MRNKKNGKEEINHTAFFSFSNLKTLSLLILIVLALRSSFWAPYYVPTASMSPTIKSGDRVLASKYNYGLQVPFTDYSLTQGSAIKRGDIIVFNSPENPKIDYVKRVIGLEGDSIKLVNDTLFINGKAQTREIFPQNTHKAHQEKNITNVNIFKEHLSDGNKHWTMNYSDQWRHPSLKNWPKQGSYTVPSDSVFVLGDNRDKSRDSRIWGEVPRSYVKGKVLFVLWSLAKKPNKSFPQIRFERFGKKLD